jgi:pimeloyl-ACP methyl ester carboxylesterase
MKAIAARARSLFLSSALLGLCSMAQSAGSTLPQPLVLRDEGSFFVGGQIVHTEHPSSPATALLSPGHIRINQMYVQYKIPVDAGQHLPVVMVHGANHTGVTYETTPDGREGWATYFARQGHPVYVVDHAGRGRSGFDPTVVNQARTQNNASLLPAMSLYPREGAWVNFRFGAAYPTPFPGLRFPIEAMDQYQSQLVPNTETTLAGSGTNTVNGLVALLDRIGPAILMVHSQSGSYGLNVIRQRPSLVKAFINVEGNCGPLSDAEVPAFARVPTISVWGDNSPGAVGANGDTRRNGCISAIGQARTAGGDATFLLLPDLGISGNSHMMMMDRNNLHIADLLLEWIGPREREGRGR